MNEDKNEFMTGEKSRIIPNQKPQVFFVLVVHISPCVVSVTAAAAADFPGFRKPYTAANL